MRLDNAYLFKHLKLNKMTTINELKQAITENKILVWNDPNYIEGGDYTINFIEDIDLEIFDEDTPILIQYGKRSEAEVYLNEIVERSNIITIN